MILLFRPVNLASHVSILCSCWLLTSPSVIMERPHVTRRSVSHGDLNCAYGSYGGRRPSFRPCPSLRTVNDNDMLLSRPGPLESMLKMTTETGDIGFFSITSTPSNTNFHHRLTVRPGFSDNAFQRRPNSRGSSATAAGFQDDRHRLPSYRDTASEIPSLYGTGSQRPAYGSWSPAYNWSDGRSNSIMGCDSRHVHSSRSKGTLQGRPSRGALQRPRSPFPCPTHLKGPGVRPSSPAPTENGSVDYSRTVEIDRMSSVRQPQGTARRRPDADLRNSRRFMALAGPGRLFRPFDQTSAGLLAMQFVQPTPPIQLRLSTVRPIPATTVAGPGLHARD